MRIIKKAINTIKVNQLVTKDQIAELNRLFDIAKDSKQTKVPKVSKNKTSNYQTLEAL